MGRRSFLLAVVCFALAGCGTQRVVHIPLDATLARPSLTQPVVGVAQDDNAWFVAAADKIDILRADMVVATSMAPPGSGWSSIATIPALAGEGRWVVATDRAGRVWRISTAGDRSQIDASVYFQTVRSLLAFDSTMAFVLDNGVVLGDRKHLRRYAVNGTFAVGRNRLARATADGVEVWDLARATRKSFAVTGAKSVAFIGSQLVVATMNALLVEVPEGLRHIALDGIRSIATTDKIWILTSNHLYEFDGRSLVKTDVVASDIQNVFGTTESLWAVRSKHIERFSDTNDDDHIWYTKIAPIFRRSCAACHLPRGDAGLDLSSSDAWRQHRHQIRERVLIEQSMPPSQPVTDNDRRVLDAWLN